MLDCTHIIYCMLIKNHTVQMCVMKNRSDVFASRLFRPTIFNCLYLVVENSPLCACQDGQKHGEQNFAAFIGLHIFKIFFKVRFYVEHKLCYKAISVSSALLKKQNGSKIAKKTTIKFDLCFPASTLMLVLISEL